MVVVCLQIAHYCISSLEQVDTICIQLLDFVGMLIAVKRKTTLGSNYPCDLIDTIECLHDNTIIVGNVSDFSLP